MIDIHCHILPGIDDGPSDIEESIEMARCAAADGISKIVATPHVKEELHPPKFLLEQIERFNEKLREEKIQIEILPGADVYVLLEIDQIVQYPINNSHYVLIEFPHSHIPHGAKNILFQLRSKGYYPIITHPERNGSVLQNPEALFDLLGQNIYVQITADSLTGGFGPDSQACAAYLLRNDAVHFIATDAHSAHHRRPILSSAVSVAKKIIGKKKALQLVIDHPAAIINGNTIHG